MSAMAGPVQKRIEECLQATLAPTLLEVLNESNSHNVPAGSETHFKVTVVSPVFAGERRIGRHRIVNKLLADELAGEVHALSIHAFDPDEWAERNGQVADSPDWLGGKARESAQVAE